MNIAVLTKWMIHYWYREWYSIDTEKEWHSSDAMNKAFLIQWIKQYWWNEWHGADTTNKAWHRTATENDTVLMQKMIPVLMKWRIKVLIKGNCIDAVNKTVLMEGMILYWCSELSRTNEVNDTVLKQWIKQYWWSSIDEVNDAVLVAWMMQHWWSV